MGHLNGLAFIFVLTAKSQNLLDHITGMFAGVKHFLQILSDLFIDISVHQNELGITDNDGKNVIKIMCDSAGQRSDGFHLLGLLELFFESFFFLFGLLELGDVMRYHHRLLGSTVFIIKISSINQRPILSALFSLALIFDSTGNLFSFGKLI